MIASTPTEKDASAPSEPGSQRLRLRAKTAASGIAALSQERQQIPQASRRHRYNAETIARDILGESDDGADAPVSDDALDSAASAVVSDQQVAGPSQESSPDTNAATL